MAGHSQRIEGACDGLADLRDDDMRDDDMRSTETLREHFTGIARPVRCLDEAARGDAVRYFGALPPAIATGSHLGVDLSPFGLGECIASALSSIPVVLADYLAPGASEEPCHVDLRPLGGIDRLVRLVPDKHRKVILRRLPPLSRDALDILRGLPMDRSLGARVLGLVEAVLGAGSMDEQAIALARASLDAIGIRRHRLIGWSELYRNLRHADVMSAPESHRAVREALLTDPETARFVRDDDAPGGATHLYRAVCACGHMIDLTYRASRSALEGSCTQCGAIAVPLDEVRARVRVGTLVPTGPLYYHDVSLVPGIPCGGGPRFNIYFPSYVAAWTHYYEAVDGPRSQRAAILREDFNSTHQTMFALLFDEAGLALGSLAAAALGPLSRPQALNDVAMGALHAANARVMAPLRHAAGKFRALLRPVAHGLPAAHVLARRTRQAEPAQPRVAESSLPRDAIEQSLYACFRAQAATHRDRIALRAPSGELSYAELARRVASYGAMIQRRTSDVPERVGLLCEHDLAIPVAMLAAAAAGKTYVPLDPRYPESWLELVVADADVSALVADRATLPLATQLAAKCGLPIIELDSAGEDVPPSHDVRPDSLAYLLYTSGTTGRPKGVMQTHRGVLHHAQTYIARLGIGPGDRVSLLASYCFDAAVMDIYGALLAGATLALYDVRSSGLVGLAEWLRREQVTIFHATPTVYRELLASLSPGERLDAIRLVVLGGEAATRQDLDRFRAHFPPNAVLVNGLGPTESTLALQYWAEHGSHVAGPYLPVGVPVEHTDVTLIDDSGKESDEGEIVISSPYVALGYWRNPTQTAKAFVPAPLFPGSRAYRTGDLGRRLSDGNVVFLGRRDFQVKIRGFRVEPEEIESTLRELSSLVDVAVVAARDKANQLQLVAYVVPATSPAPPPSELRAFVDQRLPHYMVPAIFVVLDALPRTATGKLDRKALPAPELAVRTQPVVAPRTPGEELIAGIWRDLLGIDAVGVHDDFHELGGHSLVATQIVARIRRSVDVEVPVRVLLQAKTIAEQAHALDGRTVPVARILDSQQVQGSLDRAAPAMAAQEYFWYLHESDPEPSSYALQLVLAIHGLRDPAKLKQAVEDTVAGHDIFRTAFREVEGRLFQFVERTAPRFELEIADHCSLAEAEHAAEIDRTITAFAGQLDLATASMIRGRLLAFGSQRHVLVLVITHAICDGTTRFMLEREIFRRYRHGDAEPDQRPSAYVEYAQAFDRFARTPAGRERHAWWQDWLHGVRPLALPFDFPRYDADARRDAARYGIVAEPMHPMFSVEVPTALRVAIGRVASEHNSSASVVYLATLLRLVQELAHQDDICIESVYDARADYRVEQILGPIATWTTMRFDVSSCRTLRDTMTVAQRGMQEAYDHTSIPGHFATVPPQIRGTCFNYFPKFNYSINFGDVKVSPIAGSYPLYKRHWHLMLFVVDSARGGILNWTGNRRLWRQETIQELARRYLVRLEQQLESR